MGTTHSLSVPSGGQQDSSPKKGKVLCFVSAKGGSGKTILAATTSTLLMQSDKKVLVIDADFSTRGLSLYLLDALTNSLDPDILPENCVADALLTSFPAEKMIPLVVPQRNGEFSILLPNSDFRRGGAPEDKLLRLGQGEASPSSNLQPVSSLASTEPNAGETFEMRYMSFLRSVCTRFRKEFDFIIIDTRGGYDFSSKIPALLADAYVIVVEADPISLQQVFGLKTKIDEFAREQNLVPNHKGFIVNKSLVYPHEGTTFSKGLSDLYGGTTFGIIPADRNAISAYQTRDIPFRKNAGSDFSYYSLLAITAFLESLSLFRAGMPPISKEVTKRIRNAWLIGTALGIIERYYSVAILTSLLIFVACFSAYSYGYIWSSVGLVFKLAWVVAILAVFMPLIRVWMQARTSGIRKLKSWILPTITSIAGAVLFAYTGPAVQKALTSNFLLAQAKALREQIYNLSTQYQDSSASLVKANEQNQLAALETEQFKKQLAATQVALTSAQNDAATARTMLVKLQASPCSTSTCPTNIRQPESGTPKSPNSSSNPTATPNPSSCLEGDWQERLVNQQSDTLRWTINVQGNILTLTRTDKFVTGLFSKSGDVWNGDLRWGNGEVWSKFELFPSPDCRTIKTNNVWYYSR